MDVGMGRFDARDGEGRILRSRLAAAGPPERQGRRATAHNRDRALAAIAGEYGRDHSRSATYGARQESGGDNAFGRSRGRPSTETHADDDDAGLLIRRALTPGQASDKQAAVEGIESLGRTSDLIAGRGQDATALTELRTTRPTWGARTRPLDTSVACGAMKPELAS